MKGSNRMVPFLDLRTDLLTMLVLKVARLMGDKSRRDKKTSGQREREDAEDLGGHGGRGGEQQGAEERAGQAPPYYTPSDSDALSGDSTSCLSRSIPTPGPQPRAPLGLFLLAPQLTDARTAARSPLATASVAPPACGLATSSGESTQYSTQRSALSSLRTSTSPLQ